MVSKVVFNIKRDYWEVSWGLLPSVLPSMWDLKMEEIHRIAGVPGSYTPAL